MSWKKHFSIIKTQAVIPQVVDNRSQGYSSMTARTSSWLNIAYQGNPQRIPRYYQFQDMDSDSDINTALDTIADFCTQSEEQADEPFEVVYNGEPNESETKIIKQMLARWIKMNKFRARLWYMFRDTIKNGDAFFLRDPETQEWLWLDHFMVELVKVDETKGKIPDEYIVRGLDYNRQAKFGTKQADPNAYRTPFGTTTVGGARPVGTTSSPAGFSMVGAGADQRQRGMQGPYSQELSVIDAQFVVHLSLSIGNDINWPFGPSILEPIFKTFKQKELLEDAIIIYRVQRAPERRIFYIDVGTMPPERAKRHIEAIKNDIHQRRIPNRCLSLDTKIYLLDGRLLPLRAVIAEYNEGIQNWVYSCDPATGAVAPGKITWAGETKKQTDVIKLTLDSGETIVCTPDHPFPIAGKGFVRASDLAIGESFIPLYLREQRYNAKKNEYTQVFDPCKKTWKYVHKMVADFFGDEIAEYTHREKYASAPKDTIHHVDYDRHNNNPKNLNRMAFKDHIAFHADNGEVVKQGWERLKDSDPTAFSQRIDQLQAANQLFWTDIERRKTAFLRYHLTYDASLFALADELICASTTNLQNSVKKAARELTSNKSFMAELAKANRAVVDKRKVQRFTFNQLTSLIAANGFASWKDYVQHLEKTGRIGRADHSLYRFNSEIWAIFTDVYNSSSATSFKKLLSALKRHKHFIDVFDGLHADGRAGLMVCDRYLDRLVKTNGYVNYRDFRSKNPNANYAPKGRSFTSRYKFDQEMLAIFKKHYDILHQDAGSVPYHRVYQSVQVDENFQNKFMEINKDSRKRRIGPTTIMEMLRQNGFVDFADFKEKYQYLNHKLASIEVVDAVHDTGTITVDGDERYHSYHTFAIEGGIFTKNSGTGGSIMDAAYNPLCMTLSTMIPLVDGRTLPLRDLIMEYQNGKTNWVYSCNPASGEVVTGPITWAGLTRKDAEVLCVTFEDGGSVIVTPDHKFPMHGGGLVQARHVTRSTELIAWNRDGGTSVKAHAATIVQLADTADTGTITVDGEEKYHAFHNFAIAENIFLQNSINDDYFFASSADGRGSKVETLPGGENVGEISDLSFFSRKLARGLRVPVSYLNIGEDQSSSITFNDGKLGAAMIQEYRFSKYCMRLQSLLAPKFDLEFKRYLQKNGIEIESSLFELQFNPPQSFTRYRQIELDSQRVQVYQGVAENKKLSERFKLARFLGLSEDEIIENEELWAEENADKMKKKTGATPAEAGAGEGLSAVGIHPEGMGEMGDIPVDDEMPEGAQAAPGVPGAGAVGAGAPAAPMAGPGGAAGAAGPGA